ncbi:hypothetical protein Hanom_Chr17g01561791 [Helianthus anomalus]
MACKFLFLHYIYGIKYAPILIYDIKHIFKKYNIKKWVKRVNPPTDLVDPNPTRLDKRVRGFNLKLTRTCLDYTQTREFRVRFVSYI